MIYITGDTHGEFSRFTKANFPEQREMTRDDYVIVLGDFGLIWDKEQTKQELYHIKDFEEERSWTTLFIDGNHENHDRLASYPVTEWHGGKVHMISPHIIHLMRGQFYDIDGYSFFVFGGAGSHDIDDGTLDPIADKLLINEYRRWNRRGMEPHKYFRVIGESWWEGEEANEEEQAEALANIAAHNHSCDFVLTHTAPTSTMLEYDNSLVPGRTEAFLETVKQQLEYKHWFFGHFHDNGNITNKEHILFGQLLRLR